MRNKNPINVPYRNGRSRGLWEDAKDRLRNLWEMGLETIMTTRDKSALPEKNDEDTQTEQDI